MSDFTNRIDDILFSKFLTRTDMYKEIPEITHQRFYQWMVRDELPKSVPLMLKIADYLDTTVEFLVRGTNTTKRYTSNEVIENQKSKLRKIAELSDLSSLE